MPDTIFEQATIDAGIAHLSRRDRKLARLLERFPPVARPKPVSLFANLCRTVCAQLLSAKAATTIFERVQASCGGVPTPVIIQAMDPADLRGTGLSGSKARCLQAIAAYWESEQSIFSKVGNSTDTEVRAALLDIKGLGPWSADMFLMFSLGRPDIYSTRDVVLANGLRLLKGLPQDTPTAKMDAVAKRWKPYRSVASMAFYIWRHNNWDDSPAGE